MKKLALVPLLLISLNIAAMQEQEKKTPEKKDTFNTYFDIGTKITAGVAFAALAFYLFNLPLKEKIEERLFYLTILQGLKKGELKTATESSLPFLGFLNTKLEWEHETIENAVGALSCALNRIEKLSIFSGISAGIFSILFFKSACKDYQELNSNNPQEELL